MTNITSTQVVGTEDKTVAVYWFGDEREPCQFGVCFPGPTFNIARQSVAESLALANEVITYAVTPKDELCT